MTSLKLGVGGRDLTFLISGNVCFFVYLGRRIVKFNVICPNSFLKGH